MTEASTRGTRLHSRRAWLCGVGLWAVGCGDRRYCGGSIGFAALTVLVFDHQTGEPVCDATAELFAGQFKVEPEANPPDCEIVFSVGVGQHQLTVEAPGYVTTSRAVVVRDKGCSTAAPMTVEVRLERV
ncbi:MAG: hypothetical protein AB7K71_05575 [Polyangiaceae bacterium]